jgi:hypothetical protein
VQKFTELRDALRRKSDSLVNRVSRYEGEKEMMMEVIKSSRIFNYKLTEQEKKEREE